MNRLGDLIVTKHILEGERRVVKGSLQSEVSISMAPANTFDGCPWGFTPLQWLNTPLERLQAC
jgi:hypothetical protein